MKIYVFLNEYLIFNCIYYKLIIIKLKKNGEQIPKVFTFYNMSFI